MVSVAFYDRFTNATTIISAQGGGGGSIHRQEASSVVKLDGTAAARLLCLDKKLFFIQKGCRKAARPTLAEKKAAARPCFHTSVEPLAERRKHLSNLFSSRVQILLLGQMGLVLKRQLLDSGILSLDIQLARYKSSSLFCRFSRNYFLCVVHLITRGINLILSITLTPFEK